MKKQVLLLPIIFIFTCLAYSQARQGNAQVNGANLYYEIEGTGTPIVFIHGVFCDTRYWKCQKDFFSKNYKTICYDARGYGKSSLPDSIQPYSQYEDLKGLLDFLKIKKAIIVGHSMGGVTAMDFAYHYPEYVLALVLAEGGSNSEKIWSPNSDVAQQLSQVWINLQNEGIASGQKTFLEIPMIQISMKNDSVKDIIQKMVLESPGWKWQFNNRQKHFKLDSLNQLRNMKMNTLLVYGEYSPEFYHKAMKTISEYMPNSQIHMLKGSSHFLSLENSNDFNQILYNFMRELKL